MSSISDSEIILDVEKLNIVYDIAVYPISSLRDGFVTFFKDPLGFLLKSPDRLHVVRDLSFSLKKGDRVGLLGINGAGKTSVCRYIAGMHGKRKNIITQGVVRAIFDTEVGIQPELSGRENAHLLAFIMFDEYDRGKVQNIVEDAIDFSELGEFADVPFKTYSKGMKARLFLSLISSVPSDLLILDEVFDGADVFFNEKIGKRVTQMIEKSGAVIFVSHSLEKIKDTCNRVIVLNNHVKEYDGDVDGGIEYFMTHCQSTGNLR